MRMKTEDFPTKGVMEISLNSEELDQMKEVLSNKEFQNVINNRHITLVLMHPQAIILDKVCTRFQFSNFVLDPYKYRFTSHKSSCLYHEIHYQSKES